MTPYRNQKHWTVGIMTAWLVVCGTLLRRRPARRRSLLTVGRLFGVKEFDTEPLPARRWSKRSSTYFTLEKPTGGTGQELIRNDPTTGKKEVVLPATNFVPEGAKEAALGAGLRVLG